MNKEKEQVCSKCGKKINPNAKFCRECGEPIIKETEIICPNCKEKISSTSKFCEQCGYKFKQPKEKIALNFNSKFITIFFLISAILGTYLLMSPGFTKWMFSMENGRLFGVISFVIATIFIIIGNIKNKFNIKDELNSIKKFYLTANITGFIFIIAGILIILSLGEKVPRSNNFEGQLFGFAGSVLLFFITIIIKNIKKLSTSINIVCQIILLIGSCVSFAGSVYLNNYGNERNSSFEEQAESLFENGTANPGNEYIEYSRYALIFGIILLVLFFIIRTSKLKENKIAIIIISILGIIFIGFLSLLLISSL